METRMNQDTTFIYKYSATEKKEVEEIRRKYLPLEESKLGELKRLDATVQKAGVGEALCAGIGGAFVFGLGMCLAMKWMGSGTFLIALGVLLGIMGMGAMLAAYPVYQKIFNHTKQKLTPRILELTAELTGKSF